MLLVPRLLKPNLGLAFPPMGQGATSRKTAGYWAEKEVKVQGMDSDVDPGLPETKLLLPIPKKTPDASF